MPHFYLTGLSPARVPLQNLDLQLLSVEQANMMGCWWQHQKTYSSASPIGEVPGPPTPLNTIMYQQNLWEFPAHQISLTKNVEKAQRVSLLLGESSLGNGSENIQGINALLWLNRVRKHKDLGEANSSWYLKKKTAAFEKEWTGSRVGCWPLFVSINKIFFFPPSPQSKRKSQYPRTMMRCSTTSPPDKYTKLHFLKSTALGTSATWKVLVNNTLPSFF